MIHWWWLIVVAVLEAPLILFWVGACQMAGQEEERMRRRGTQDNDQN